MSIQYPDSTVWQRVVNASCRLGAKRTSRHPPPMEWGAGSGERGAGSRKREVGSGERGARSGDYGAAAPSPRSATSTVPPQPQPVRSDPARSNPDRILLGAGSEERGAGSLEQGARSRERGAGRGEGERGAWSHGTPAAVLPIRHLPGRDPMPPRAQPAPQRQHRPALLACP